VAAFAIERILSRPGTTEKGFGERLDPPTQFYVLWRWGYNDWDVPDGEALLLSTAVGIELNALIDRLGLVGKVRGKLRLLGPAGRAERLERVVERVAAGGGELWPVAQAVVELLPRDNPERKALESMLGTRLDLESRARRWSETHRPGPRTEVVQGRLWEEDADE
jgi:hypothetical protein